MERFDVAVVGAGPAGSTTAYRLARAHARVLLIDKSRFPRDKPCGGGLTMRAVHQLPFSVEPVVEDRVTRIRCRLKYRRVMNRESEHVLCLMTQRRRLDEFLVEQAVEAGATFRDGVRVEIESDRRIRVDGRPLEVGALVRGYDATLVSDAHTTEDLTAWGAPPPAQVISHTNMYWGSHKAPGRVAGATETKDVDFSPA